MADRATIERVAKILAKATSDNAAEADLAIRHAFGRMQRDGVTFGELLSLPKDILFQSTLSRLAELLSRELNPDLSEGGKRELYAQLLKLIVEKFSDDELHSAPKRDGEQERERAARAYEERRRNEEARRGRSEPPPRQEQGRGEPPPRGGSTEQPQSRQNAKPEGSGDIEPPLRFDAGRVPLTFSGSAYFAFLFGPSSFLGCLFAYPKLAFFLFARSFVVGGIIATVLYVGSRLILKFYWNGAPLRWFYLLLFGDLPILGFLLIMLVTAYVLYERDWYPQGPSRGETDLLSIVRSLAQLILALLWRVYGAFLWLGNTAYVLGYKWKRTKNDGKQAKPTATKASDAQKNKDDSDETEYELSFWARIFGFIFTTGMVSVLAFVFAAFLFFIIATTAKFFEIEAVLSVLRNEPLRVAILTSVVVIADVVFWMLTYREILLQKKSS
jgi:hypothetical protein